MNMKVAKLTPLGGADGGGVPVVVDALSQSLRDTVSIQPRVYCAASEGLWANARWAGVDIQPCRTWGPAKLGALRGVLRSLEDFEPDIVHIHGLWTVLSFIHLRFQERNQSIPYLVSPHGMLDPWALQHSAWKKKLVGAMFQNSHLRKATCLHALCESELQSMRAYGLKNPIAVVPNGVDLPDPEANANETLPKWQVGERRAVLFLGRIHPKKGLPLLLDAWARLKKQDSRYADEWFLAIAGSSEGGHLEELQKQTAELNIEPDIQFLGPLYGEDKTSALTQASAFILPSYSEGLPMSVLEAWSYRLPSLITPQCNLPEAYESEAAVRIDTSVDSVVDGLRTFFSMSEHERDDFGQRAYRLVETNFTWGKVAEKTNAVYRWILGGGDRPDCVRV